MDLDLTSEQELLREATARFVGDVCPLTRVRELVEDEVGFDRDYWAQGAELGWFAMLVGEADGGGSVSGSGVMDAAVIAEERGRLVQPGPFLPANVVAASLARSGSVQQRGEVLGGLVSGDLVAAWAAVGADGAWVPGAGVQVRTADGGFVLSGVSGFVQDASAADWLLVAATGEDGVSQLLVPAGADGVGISDLVSLDLARRFGDVSFADVWVPMSALVGDLGGAGADLEWEFQVALALSVAESVGAMNALFEMSVQYAKDRTAFGRPIGSFQAIKHLLADLAFSLEACNAAAAMAARAVGEGRADAASAVRVAKSYVGDHSMELLQGCFQVHGGIAFTWEHDLHLYMRRLTSNILLFGEPSWHREQLAVLAGL
jgi:alkylation response protein AidB-like acyl-CoA dehydrogenase